MSDKINYKKDTKIKDDKIKNNKYIKYNEDDESSEYDDYDKSAINSIFIAFNIEGKYRNIQTITSEPYRPLFKFLCDSDSLYEMDVIQDRFLAFTSYEEYYYLFKKYILNKCSEKDNEFFESIKILSYKDKKKNKKVDLANLIRYSYIINKNYNINSGYKKLLNLIFKEIDMNFKNSLKYNYSEEYYLRNYMYLSDLILIYEHLVRNYLIRLYKSYYKKNPFEYDGKGLKEYIKKIDDLKKSFILKKEEDVTFKIIKLFTMGLYERGDENGIREPEDKNESIYGNIRNKVLHGRLFEDEKKEFDDIDALFNFYLEFYEVILLLTSDI